MKKGLIYFLFILGLSAKAQKLNLLPDTIGICKGETTVLEVKNTSIPKNASYHWTSMKGITDHVDNIKVNDEGKYFIKIYAGKNTYTDSCYVKFYPKPKLFIHDTMICNTNSALIDPKNNSYKYLWSNDETTSRLRIESSGLYWVKINNKGCTVVDTFRVTFNQGSVPNFGNEVSFCLSDENKTLSIKASPGTKITWSNGANTPSIVPVKAGMYWVKTDNKVCGIKTDSVNVKLKACDCEILVPNSFTPNEDDRNDYFYPVLTCDYTYYSFSVFDRWGNTVFVSNNINAKWDGRFKGNLCPDDIYVYHIETIEKNSGKKDTREGKVSLFR